MPPNDDVDQLRRDVGRVAVGVRATATLDDERLYRYELTRSWADDPELCPAVCWVMLNPSTADETEDDHTIRRCIRYSDGWGFGSMVVVNLFAFRATHPEDLRRAFDPVGHLNDASILAAAIGSELVVCAWGAHGKYRNRAAYVTNLLRWTARLPLHALELSVDGTPKHPARLSTDLRPVPYR